MMINLRIHLHVILDFGLFQCNKSFYMHKEIGELPFLKKVSVFFSTYTAISYTANLRKFRKKTLRIK